MRQLDTLNQMTATRKMAMLGDMLEMGDVEATSHKDVLDHALSLDLEIILVGPRFKQAWSTLPQEYADKCQCFDFYVERRLSDFQQFVRLCDVLTC